MAKAPASPVRTRAQRWADALVELCRGDAPVRAVPAVDVLSHHDVLAGHPLTDLESLRCDIEGFGPIPRVTLERLACDCTLSRVVMGTRSGDVDPGVIFHLHRVGGLSVDEIDDLLNRRSGLQGLCGDNNPSCATNPSDGYARQFAYGASAKFTEHLSPSSDLISISAYRRSYNQWSMDSLGAVLPLANDVWDNTSQYSEELRCVSSPVEQLKYVGGLWFMREDTNRLRMFYLPSVDPDPDHSDRYRGIDRTTSLAAFGQADA